MELIVTSAQFRTFIERITEEKPLPQETIYKEMAEWYGTLKALTKKKGLGPLEISMVAAMHFSEDIGFIGISPTQAKREFDQGINRLALWECAMNHQEWYPKVLRPVHSPDTMELFSIPPMLRNIRNN